MFHVMKVCFFLILLFCSCFSIDTTHDETHEDSQEDDSTTGPHTTHDPSDGHNPEEPDVTGAGSHYDKDGHHDTDFDHESVAGSKHEADDFKSLPPDEAKKRLAVIFNRIDVNGNKEVDQEELINYIVNSFKQLDVESAKTQLEEADSNNDKVVTWEEYVVKHYGYNLKELKDLEKEKNKDMQTFLEGVYADRAKFKLADENKDDKLNLQEFAAFVHPKNYEHMAEAQINHTLATFDKNKDGFITRQEFLTEENAHDEEIQKAEKKRFEKYDLNKDGKLDRKEIKLWSMPGLRSSAIKEMKHLFAETDKNNDKKLSKEEVLENHDLWVGSKVTDYGRHLEEMKKEEL